MRGGGSLLRSLLVRLCLQTSVQAARKHHPNDLHRKGRKKHLINLCDEVNRLWMKRSGLVFLFPELLSRRINDRFKLSTLWPERRERQRDRQ